MNPLSVFPASSQFRTIRTLVARDLQPSQLRLGKTVRSQKRTSDREFTCCTTSWHFLPYHQAVRGNQCATPFALPVRLRSSWFGLRRSISQVYSSPKQIVRCKRLLCLTTRPLWFGPSVESALVEIVSIWFASWKGKVTWIMVVRWLPKTFKIKLTLRLLWFIKTCDYEQGTSCTAQVFSMRSSPIIKDGTSGARGFDLGKASIFYLKIFHSLSKKSKMAFLSLAIRERSDSRPLNSFQVTNFDALCRCAVGARNTHKWEGVSKPSCSPK